MRRQLLRYSAVALLVALVTSSTLHAQFVVFDPANYAEAVEEVLNLVREYTWMVQQARRLPQDMASRYRVVSPVWPLYDLASGLRYAQPVLNALNLGDASGAGYRQIVPVLDLPDDILGRLPADLRQRLQTAYAVIEFADRVSAMGVDQAGSIRLNGNNLLSVIQAMQSDAVSTNDDFHTQTALLNKINGASVLALRIGEQTNQFLADTIAELVVDNTRKRDAEAVLMNATIYQWRYGQTYGENLFQNTAADLDTWRLR
jgi:hypothetical protein